MGMFCVMTCLASTRIYSTLAGPALLPPKSKLYTLVSKGRITTVHGYLTPPGCSASFCTRQR